MWRNEELLFEDVLSLNKKSKKKKRKIQIACIALAHFNYSSRSFNWAKQSNQFLSQP